MKASYSLVRPLPHLLLIAGLVLSVSGCPKKEPETSTAPPGGAYPGAPGATTGGPGGATTAGDTSTRTPGEAVSDVTMTAKVKNALMVSKVDTSRLNVDTKEGVVMLKGSVPTASQKTQAEKVAKQVEGVTKVQNQLQVGGKG